MNAEQLNTTLYEKMFAEQENFRDWLLALSPEEVLQHSYEYNIREDILLALECDDISAERAAALLSSPTPLADIFTAFEKLESDYMDTIRDCMSSRADEILSQKKRLRETPLYLQTASYATEHGEQALFRASHNANVACKEAIEKAIRENYDGQYLNVQTAFVQVRDLFGAERMKYVLGATVREKSFDGRISHENKAWAKTVPIADGTTGWGDNRNSEFVVDKAHPVLVDAFASYARKEFAKEPQVKKPSIFDQIHKPLQPAKAVPKKAEEPSL